MSQDADHGDGRTSRNRNQPRHKRPKLGRPTSYEVGYAKPPGEHRFQPGQSGNPKGRPKGARNKRTSTTMFAERLKGIVLEEAYRTITVRDGDQAVTVPMAQAIVRSTAVNAAKGQPQAQRLFTELLLTTEAEFQRADNEWVATAMQYKTDWELELARRERLGITDLPPPLPHPDHIIIDIRAGTARIVGPATKEEQVTWDLWAKRKKDTLAELEMLQRKLKRTRRPETRQILEDEIRHNQGLLDIVRRLILD